MIGQTLNWRYKITSPLGEGGMGEVYLATDKQTRQQVAVKVLARQLSAHPEALERFRREAETLRKLDHPNIVKLIDSFEYKKQYIIVMEYVPGGSLYQLLKAGSLSIETACRIALELCDALIRSHHLNIIHRDIKPENVLMDQHGTPKLADFGVARLNELTRMTRSGTQVGTPHYMSPEAWEGKKLDAQADIWSLGVMLFEMLAGQVPFDGDTPLAVMNRVYTTTPPDLEKLRVEVPAELVKIVNRMLTREKEERYQTMRQVAVDLERIRLPKPALSDEDILEFPGKADNGVTDKNDSNRGGREKAERLGPKTDRSKPAVTPARRRPTMAIVVALIGFVVISIAALVVLPKIGDWFSSTPTTLTSLPTENKNGQDVSMILIPAGEFTMGSDTGFSNESPAHIVSLDAFYIDEYEVTNALYRACVEALGACKRPADPFLYNNLSRENHPVVRVDWEMAKDYCEWRGARLPTEAEWEKAARGTDALTYPWGEDMNTEYANYDSDTTRSVDHHPNDKSIYGVYNMAGNVSEWVFDWYSPEYYQFVRDNDNSNPAGFEDSPYPSSHNFYGRVFRGGSWKTTVSSQLSTTYRYHANPDLYADDLGFRCARDANP